jgi:Fe-S oxidoreductase
MRGDVLRDGWHDDNVKEALDLCLGCKGCKGDCPVSVDVATYKAEFLAHYYAGRPRPRSAYAFGLIMYWARLASLAPRLVNFFTQSPLLSWVAKAAIGMAPERRIPVFATHTFRQWFSSHQSRDLGAQSVVLWPDTFNNYFHPEIAQAAVDVLESAGFHVTVPAAWVCCGRPMYDYGMLRQAKALLRRTMEVLGPQIEAGIPIVGLEPSCVAVFRDELPNLYPKAARARKLASQMFTLSEFLEKHAPNFKLQTLDRSALVQAHCHQRAIMGVDADQALLEKLGLDHEILDSGCCGMAGSFGFEAGERYSVSVKAGERALLPAVRAVNADALVIADGFSCREQIAQGAQRRALHIAEVLQLALHQR